MALSDIQGRQILLYALAFFVVELISTILAISRPPSLLVFFVIVIVIRLVITKNEKAESQVYLILFYTLTILLTIAGIARGIEQIPEVLENGTLAMILAFLSWDGILPYLLLLGVIIAYGNSYEKASKVCMRVWVRLRKILGVVRVAYRGKSKSEELREAKALLDEGLINEDDYEQMKKEILGK